MLVEATMIVIDIGDGSNPAIFSETLPNSYDHYRSLVHNRLVLHPTDPL